MSLKLNMEKAVESFGYTDTFYRSEFTYRYICSRYMYSISTYILGVDK